MEDAYEDQCQKLVPTLKNKTDGNRTRLHGKAWVLAWVLTNVTSPGNLDPGIVLSKGCSGH